MNQLNKGKAKYSSVWVSAVLLLFITLCCSAAGSGPAYFHSFLTADTIPVKTNTKIDSAKTASQANVAIVEEPAAVKTKADTSIVVTKDTFGFKTSKDSLDAPVFYHADDSMIMDIPEKKIILYGKETRVEYIDNKLVSPRIEFDQRTNLVSAYLIKDSNGNVIAYPRFNQADFKTMSDSIRFNMKTGKGITKGTYTQQDEIFFYGEKLKKVDKDVFYVYRGKFTTCNLDTPHFAFVSKKIKYIPSLKMCLCLLCCRLASTR
jgi:LPS-assembly protein